MDVKIQNINNKYYFSKIGFKNRPSKTRIKNLTDTSAKTLPLITSAGLILNADLKIDNKNDINKKIRLIKQKYDQNKEFYKKVVTFSQLIDICSYSNGIISNSVIDKLFENFDDKKNVFDYIFSIQNIHLSSIEYPTDLTEKLLENPYIYIDPFINNDANAILIMLENLYKNNKENELLLAHNLITYDNISLNKLQNLLFITSKDSKKLNTINKLIINKDYPIEFITSDGDILCSPISKKVIQDFNQIKKRMLERPELYINGEIKDKTMAQYAIIDFLHKFGPYFPRVIDTFDKETVDYLLRQRIRTFSKSAIKLFTLNKYELNLIKDFQNSLNLDGKPFLAKQKAEILDLLLAYRENNMPLDDIENMIKNNKVDLAHIYLNIFNSLLTTIGLSQEEINNIPLEKLQNFDISKSHLLLKSIKNDESTTMKDLLTVMFKTDFIDFLHSSDSQYGIINKKTENIFKQNNFNYELWLNPLKSDEVGFKHISEEDLTIQKTAREIEDQIEILRESGAKDFIDKQLAHFIINDKFVIPEKMIKNKFILYDTIEKIEKQLEPVLKRARENALSLPEDKYNDSEKVARRILRACGTLNILDQIRNKKLFLYNYQSQDTSKIDVTIKMWDRNPFKDMLQGDFSNCCLAIGHDRDFEIADYLLNTMFNMIEIKDNKTSDIIGNALIYFVEDKEKKKYLMIDNIEINPEIKLSDTVQIKLRKAIVNYAKNVVKSIAKNEEINIIIGTMNNDLHTHYLEKRSDDIKFVGEINTDKVYLDAFTGYWKREEDEYTKIYYNLT